jgi:hypothetical protein
LLKTNAHKEQADVEHGRAAQLGRIATQGLIHSTRICAVLHVSASIFLAPLQLVEELENNGDLGDSCGYNVTGTGGDNRCAVDSWVLFTTNKDPICCLPGEIGTNAATDENYGHCLAAGLSVPSPSLATLVCSRHFNTEGSLVSKEMTDWVSRGNSSSYITGWILDGGCEQSCENEFNNRYN